MLSARADRRRKPITRSNYRGDNSKDGNMDIQSEQEALNEHVKGSKLNGDIQSGGIQESESENENESERDIMQSDDAQENDMSSDETQDNIFTQAKTQLEIELNRIGGRFNPHPDDTEVRELRTGYAKLFHEAKQRKGELVQPESTRLDDMLNDANELMNRVRTTADATLDSRFVAMSADLGAEKMNKLATGILDFSVSDFTTLVKSALVKSSGIVAIESMREDIGEYYDWETIGGMAARHWRGVTAPDFFLGPITVEVKEKRPKNRVMKEKKVLEPVVQPTVLDAKDPSLTGGTSETAEKVRMVYRILESLSLPVPFYKFVVHPTSFARTVENLFYVSFLASDNRIRLEPSERDGFVIHIIDDEEDEEIVKPKFQRIYPMTMSLWREKISQYGITVPILDF